MPAPYERHVFVCINRREDGHPRGCCASKGGEAVHAALKAATKDAGLNARVRINKAGCLDVCERGVSVVVYPEGVWYQGVAPADAAAIVGEHLVGGRPVRRLAWAGVPPAE